MHPAKNDPAFVNKDNKCPSYARMMLNGGPRNLDEGVRNRFSGEDSLIGNARRKIPADIWFKWSKNRQHDANHYLGLFADQTYRTHLHGHS